MNTREKWLAKPGNKKKQAERMKAFRAKQKEKKLSPKKASDLWDKLIATDNISDDDFRGLIRKGLKEGGG